MGANFWEIILKNDFKYDFAWILAWIYPALRIQNSAFALQIQVLSRKKPLNSAFLRNQNPLDELFDVAV